MWIIGVTGALGAGKTTVSEQFQALGIPMHCADNEIHTILNQKETQEKISSFWPELFSEKKFNKAVLRDFVLEDPTRLTRLETLLYPSLAQSQKEFIEKNFLKKSQAVVLDVPLLIEVGLQLYCHRIVLVETPVELRKNRVLQRKGMSLEKFEKLESNQTSDDVRRQYADFVIQTGRKKTGLKEKVREILSSLSKNPSPVWDKKWPTTFQKDLYGKRNCS